MCIVVYKTQLYHRLSQQHSVLGLSHIKSLGQSQHCATLAVKGLPIGSLQQFKVTWSSCCAGGQTTKPHEGELPPSFHMHYRLFTVTSVVRSRSGTYPAIRTMLCFRTITSDMYGPIPLKHSRTRPKHYYCFLAEVGTPPRYIRTDDSGEYSGIDMHQFVHIRLERGIQPQKVAPYSSHQNVRVERTHRSLLTRTRALHHAAQLLKSVWGLPFGMQHAS